ncbi:unnamed protein product, partial [Mesorhabditis spiculigera]
MNGLSLARIRLRSVLMSCRQNSSANFNGGVSLSVDASTGKETGRFKQHNPPIYVGPHVNPLDVGPDFSFVDGRPCYFTSRRQLERKKEQIRLGERIVSLLDQMNDLQKIHEEADAQRRDEQNKINQRKPQAKGTKTIDQF